MKEFKNFSLYKPENNSLPEYVLYLKSEDGIDWYEAQKKFSPESVKLVYGCDGMICSAGKDASGLWPVNCSVAEVAAEIIPTEFLANEGWAYENGTVRKILIDPIAQANEKRSSLLEKATVVIAPLQDAIDLNVATDEEVDRLHRWKTYRVSLGRLDTKSAPNISWPEQPQ